MPDSKFTHLGRRDRRDLELLSDPPAKLEILPSALARLGCGEVLGHLDRRHVNEHKVRAVGPGVGQPNFVKVRCEDVSPFGVSHELVFEELPLARLLQTDRDGFLHGRVGAEDDTAVGGSSGCD